jgi:hypothetical protein
VKYWEIIADNLSKAGWSWGCVSTINANGRKIWIVDAYRDDGRRFIVHADEKLSAFVELERQVLIRDVLSRIHSMTVIEIRPHRWGWKVFEAPGVEPVFPKKDQATEYAQNHLLAWRDRPS